MSDSNLMTDQSKKALKKKIDQQIRNIALPSILTNFSVPLIGSVDTYLMGQQSVALLGAVGLSSMIFSFLYWNFGFLRMGTTGLIAQAHGKSAEVEKNKYFTEAFMWSMIIALLMIVTGPWLSSFFKWLTHVPPELSNDVSDYFQIRIWAAPATLGLYVIFGWFFGSQNARSPLFITIVSNLINVFCSWYLVSIMNYGIDGVAWGTVIAQYVGFVVGMLLLSSRLSGFIKAIPDWIHHWASSTRIFFHLNGNIFIRTLCLSSAFLFFNSEAARLGTTILASAVIYLQFLNWMSYGIDGFAYASESVIGMYKGERNEQKMNITLHRVFTYGMGVAVIYMMIYGICGGAIFDLFSDQAIGGMERQAVILWAVLTPIFAFSSYIWDGVFIGLTASAAMRNSMLLSLVVYILCHYILISFQPLSGMFLALNIFLLTRGGIQWWLFRRYSWRIK